MTEEMEFKTIAAQYCSMKPEDIKNEMKFREDLEFSSLDFMTFLGELEDTFDIELEQEEVMQVSTVAEALDLIKRLQMEG